MAKPVVLVVEDHPLYRQALGGLASLGFPKAQVESFADAESALAFLAGLKDGERQQCVVLLNPSLPGLSGLPLIERLNVDFPGLTLVVISGSNDPLFVSACFGAGISAFVNKAAAPDLMLQLLGRAIQDELEGPEWLSASGPCDFNELSTFHLTSRQLQVLGLIAQGLTNRQIADRLGIIEATAKAHVSAIFRELGVTNRTQALLKARRLGL